jgi:MFS family permease
MLHHKKNVNKLYAFSFFQTFLILQPIIVPFWQDKNLTLQEIFSLQAIFGLTLVVLDIPAGYAADLLSRKKVLIIGCAISGLGFQVLWFAESFLHFVIFEILLAIGYSFQSGCDISILYDSIEKSDQKVESSRILGNRVMFSTLGEATSALIGGGLALISLSWPAYVTAITAWIPLLIGFAVCEPERKRFSRDSHLKNLMQIKKSLFSRSKFLPLVILSSIFYNFATYSIIWSIPPFWKDKGIQVSDFGYLFAVNSFLAAAVSRYAYIFERKLGIPLAILVISISPIVGYFGMSLIPGSLAVMFMLMFPICAGLNKVLFQDIINNNVPSEMRSITNSLGAFGTRVLFVVFGPLLGSLLDQKGSVAAMFVMGCVYLFGFFLIAAPLFFYTFRSRETRPIAPPK